MTVYKRIYPLVYECLYNSYPINSVIHFSTSNPNQSSKGKVLVIEVTYTKIIKKTTAFASAYYI